MAVKKKYYAWTNIRCADGGVVKNVTIGSEVTKTQLGLSDDEWAKRIERGLIRNKPYPNVPSSVSRKQHQLKQANRMMDAAVADTPYDTDAEPEGEEVVDEVVEDVPDEPTAS